MSLAVRPVSPPRPLAAPRLAAAPARVAASPARRAQATDALVYPEKPKTAGFGDAAAYKAYALALVALVQESRTRLDVPYRELHAAHAALQAKSIELLPPLTEAQRAFYVVHDEYQPAIDTAKQVLAKAKAAHYEASHPGLPTARALESQVSRLESEIRSRRSRISSANSEISSLRYRINSERLQEEPNQGLIISYQGRINTLENEVHRLESEIRSRNSQIWNLKGQINYHRNRLNPPDHPAVVAAQKVVDAANAQLASAQAAYDEATAPTRAARDQAQRVYDAALAPEKEVATRLKAQVDAIEKPMLQAVKDFDALGKDVGFFVRAWWTFTGFPLGRFLEEQQKLVHPAPAGERGA